MFLKRLYFISQENNYFSLLVVVNGNLFFMELYFKPKQINEKTHFDTNVILIYLQYTLQHCGHQVKLMYTFIIEINF